MPFTAESRPSTEAGGDTWERVCATDLSHAEMIDMRATHELRCPDPQCHATLHVRLPAAARQHFAHNPREGSADCLLRGGETPAHLEAKATVAAWAKAHERYRGGAVDLEQILDNGLIRRVADVLVRFPDGEMQVIECQVSYQTIAEFRERTEDYYALGADYVLWFVDESRLRGDLGEWARQQWEVGHLVIRDEVIAIT